jgi:iron transport multicopper oxidase
LNWNVTGWLVYDDALALPVPTLVDELNPFDDMTLLPYDNQTLLGEPDQIVELAVIMDNLGDGAS